MAPLLPTLYALASQVGKSDDPHAATSAILSEVANFFAASSASLSLLNPDTRTLQIEASIGLPEKAAELELRLGQGITGWCAFHGRSVLVHDVDLDARYLGLRDGIRCEMAAPLIHDEDGQVLGVITIDGDKVGAYTAQSLSALEAFAREASTAIQRIWQFHHLSDKARQLETLTNVGLSLVSKLQQQEILDTVTWETRTIFNSRLVVLYLHDASARTMRASSWAGPSQAPEISDGELAMDDCLSGMVVRTEKLTEFSQMREGEFVEFADIPKDPELRSALLAPLTINGSVIGVLAAFGGQPHRYNNDEKRLFTALAGLGVVALENARLYARVFQSEDTLRKGETLNTLGLLAAEIAHEIRTPLTVIKLLYGSLGLDFPPEDLRAKDTRIISEKLNQLEAIVSRVLNFAKAPFALHSLWSIDEIVSDTLHLIRLKLHQNKIALRYEACPQSWVIDANKGQLQQVFLNLLINATHAMPDGGTITVTVTREPRESGACAHIDIADTGTGIADEIRARVFDSFLSGRPGGTGLGLGIVKRITQAHRGDVCILQTSSAGTTMRVTLPLAG